MRVQISLGAPIERVIDMNYIFLDVDGVLNDKHYLLFYADEDGVINQKSVDLLAKLVKQFDAKVILSSSWRNGFDDNMQPNYLTIKNGDGTEQESRCAKLLRMLNEADIVLCGKTGSVNEGIHWGRPTEIYNYVKEHLAPEDNYVILDDDDVVGEAHPDLISELAPHFVHTSFVKRGFDEKAFEKAVIVLQNK